MFAQNEEVLGFSPGYICILHVEFRQSLIGEKYLIKKKLSMEFQVIKQLLNDSSYKTSMYVCVMDVLETRPIRNHFVSRPFCRLELHIIFSSRFFNDKAMSMTLCLFVSRVVYFVSISTFPDESNPYLQSSPWAPRLPPHPKV